MSRTRRTIGEHKGESDDISPIKVKRPKNVGSGVNLIKPRTYRKRCDRK